MRIEVRDIYRVYREYQQDPKDGKRRPNLILAVVDDDVYILPLTRTGPKEPPRPYDKWKVEVKEWREAGLDQPSWVEVNQLKVIDRSAISREDTIWRTCNRMTGTRFTSERINTLNTPSSSKAERQREWLWRRNKEKESNPMNLKGNFPFFVVG